MFANTSISDLLMTIASLGQLVIKLLLLYFIWVILSWIIRTFVIPFFERRAYFYKYSFDIWYFEKFRKFLWVFKWGRNKRWAIHRTLIGYVTRKAFRDNQDDASNDIYTVGYFGRERIGQAKFINGVCNIILRKTNAQGDEFNDNDPVGYIDKTGKIFKYFMNRKAMLNGDKLKTPVFIGQCEDPRLLKKKEYKTKGEESDDATLPHITDVRSIEAEEEGMPRLGDTWFSFRENYPDNKNETGVVKTICLKSSGAVPDGRKRPVGLGLWRYLQVFAFPWDYKRLAWGYGYCKEDFLRMPLKENDNGIRLINRAGAALLLIEQEGFLDYEDEKVRDNRKGMAATALLSLCMYYLGFYWLWLAVNSFEIFPFLGTMLSRIAGMVLLFFFIWLVIHTLRKVLFDITPRFERFLEMLNRNTGVIGWVSFILGLSFAGLCFSFFIIAYPFAALFFCTFVAALVNRVAFKQRKWEVDDPFKKRRKEDDDHREDDNEDDEPIPADDLEIREYKWHLSSAIKSIQNKFELQFSRNNMVELRLQNPFRQHWTGENYAARVVSMIQDEFNKPGLHSKIRAAKARLNKIAADEDLSYLDKIHLIVSFSQPPNLEYEFDHECLELVVDRQSIPSELLENPESSDSDKGFKEYCRFPTESLYDKRGDCDCHAAITAALLAACGITSCYITGNVNDGTGHAAVGVECTSELLRFMKHNNYFLDYETGIKFLYVETTGSQSKIGDIPAGFENMLNGKEMQIAILHSHTWDH